jgi:DNA-binding CsgD family transcriptional regulator
MVGRARELEALEDWLDAVAAGAAGAALLEGEAGIGKTRLAAAACESAAKRSFAVSTASADELDRGRPFGVLGDALGSRLEAPVGSVAVPGLEFRLVDQLVEQVEATALRGPALIVIEDLQWADPGTVVALRALGRRLAHLPLALLGTFRSWPRSAELDRLINVWRDEDALHLVLGGLDQASVVALASALVGAPVGAGLEQELESTGGNPLFVGELVGALVGEGSLELVDGRAELHARSLPPSLRVTILRRVGLLGDRTLSLLRVASVLGTTFSLANLATVCRRPAAELMDELLGARAAGVVEDTGPLLRFRHALIREALYTDLPETARAALHAEAARLLAATGAARLLVAEQFSLGASPGDREAVSWLREAARESVLRAPQSAVALLERAVELSERGDPTRDELLAELADALVWSRRPRDGQALAAELLVRATTSSTREHARATLVRGLWLDARWGELLEHVDRWLDAGELTDRARGRALADAAMAAVFNRDAARGESMAREALELGESLGDDAIVFQALIALGPVLSRSGRKAEDLAVAERAVAIATRAGNPDPSRFVAHFALALALEGNGRLEEAEAMFNTGMRVGEELGAVWHLPMYQAGLAALHCHMGKWDEALVEAETALTIGEEVGTRIGMVACTAVAALIRAQRDDLVEAERLLALARREIDRAGPQWGSYWSILASAEIAEAHGDREAALAGLRDDWAALADSPGLQVSLGTALVRRALAAGELELARSVAATVETNARTINASSAKGSALLCRGLAEGDPDVLARAVAEFRASGWLPHVAVASEETATALGRDDDLAAARPLFEEALSIYEGLGARRDTARALATMRSFGMRRGSRAAHRRALNGWDSLTPTESDVVRLTVAGLTNREIGERLFISRRTVQTHLSHVFTKLEISTRVELAAAVATNRPA